MSRAAPWERLLGAASRGHEHASSIGWKTAGRRFALDGFDQIIRHVKARRPLSASDFHLIIAKCKWMRKTLRMGMNKNDAITMNRNIREIEKVCLEAVQPQLPGFSEADQED